MLAGVAFLSGCVTTQGPTSTVTSGVRTEVVYKSVLEPCVYVDEVPKIPGTYMNETQTKEQRRAAKLADGNEIEQYVIKADSLLRGCAKPRTEAPK